MRKFFVWGALLLCLSLTACSASLFRNYGRIDPSTEATRAFEEYRVDEGVRYYISGSDFYPNALMGLKRDHRLNPATLWKQVMMTPATMRGIVNNMQTKAGEYHHYLHGFNLIDDQGRTIGCWYSIPEARTYVRREADGTFTIDTPPLDTYIRLEPVAGQP